MTFAHDGAPIVELELIAPIQGGQMLARLSGQVVFVHGGIPGEAVTVGEPLPKRGYLEADASSVVRIAEARVEPPCPYFGENGRERGSLTAPAHERGPVCGGCQYQHIGYEKKLSIKFQVIREQLRRVGKILDAPLHDVVPSPSPFHYRNKASWLVTEDGELAYHEARSHQAVAISECHLLAKGVHRVLDDLRIASAELGFGGLVRGIEARVLPAGDGERGSLLLTIDPATTDAEVTALSDALLEACPTIHGVTAVSTNRESAAVTLAGDARMHADFGQERFWLSPTTFFQVNGAVADKLSQTVLGLLGPLEGKLIVDVFSGAGMFALPIARQADAVIAIEVDAVAVADARETMADYGIENVTLLQGDAGFNLRSLLPGSAHAVIVDPPRTGCSPEVLRQLARVKAPRLIYVSCDPATLARDLRFLIDHGYQLESVQPYDLFPQTSHIESVSALKLPRKFQARR
jgi:23S rRNA (uracil1939-C5)-methyltransferase